MALHHISKLLDDSKIARTTTLKTEQTRMKVEAQRNQIQNKQEIGRLATQQPGALNQVKSQLTTAQNLLGSNISQLQNQSSLLGRSLLSADSKLSVETVARKVFGECIGYVLSDRVDLYIDSLDGEEDITAVALNAGAVGTVIREFEVLMVTNLDQSGGDPIYALHSWSSFPMASGITPGESVADADVGVPTVAGLTEDGNNDPLWVDGKLNLKVTFDTDAGSTKVYASGDSVTVQIDISGIIPILPTVTLVTKTYNVV